MAAATTSEWRPSHQYGWLSGWLVVRMVGCQGRQVFDRPGRSNRDPAGRVTQLGGAAIAMVRSPMDRPWIDRAMDPHGARLIPRGQLKSGFPDMGSRDQSTASQRSAHLTDPIPNRGAFRGFQCGQLPILPNFDRALWCRQLVHDPPGYRPGSWRLHCRYSQVWRERIIVWLMHKLVRFVA